MGPLKSPQQELYAQTVASGKNQSDSYRVAYPKSLAWKPESVNERASILMRNVKVSSRVAELRKPAAEKAGLTLDEHLSKLQELRDSAMAEGKWSEAIKAELHRGQATGLYVTKHEDVTDPLQKALGNMKPAEAQSILDSLDQVARIKAKSAP